MRLPKDVFEGIAQDAATAALGDVEPGQLLYYEDMPVTVERVWTFDQITARAADGTVVEARSWLFTRKSPADPS